MVSCENIYIYEICDILEDVEMFYGLQERSLLR